MKKYFFLFCICMLVSTVVYPEGTESQKQSKVNKFRGTPIRTKFNINNISTVFKNDGISDIDVSESNSGFVFPKGSGKTAVFISGFIWGGKVSNEIRVGGSTYNTGLQPGRIISINNPEDPSLYHVRIYRVRSDYATADLWEDALDMGMTINEVYIQYDIDWNEWPAIYGAPYEDLNNNGAYDPSVDIPGIPGADQTIWFVANDLDPARTNFLYGSPPIGIELQVTIWGYNRADSFGDLMFRKYKLINKSGNDIEDMYVSMWSDPDVGNAADDFVGCDSTLSLAYAYNAFTNDAMYGRFPPAVGYTFMQGPMVEGEPSDIGIFDGTEYPGMRNLPMNAFYFFISNDPVFGDPPLGTYQGSLEFYNLLQGKVGSTGDDFIDPITLQPTKFPLSGEPLTDEGWIDGLLHAAGDRRMGMASGPFNMAPSDTQEVIVVEMAELTGNPNMAHINNIYGLKRKSLNIKGVLVNNMAVDLYADPILPLNEETEITSSALLINKDAVIQSFLWNIEIKPAGSNAVFNGIDFSKALLTPDIEGYYTISLLAVSDMGDSALGKINIYASSNNPPIADFTLSKTELIMGDTATADGSFSSDIEGDSLEFEWGGNLWYNDNNAETTAFQPMRIGETNVLLDVSDGMFTSSATKTVNVSPKFDGMTEKWIYLDTNYYYRDIGIFSHGDTTIGVPLLSWPHNIDSSKIVIYNRANDGMEFIKEIPLPDCSTIETIKNDLLFVEDISNSVVGFYGVGKLSIYRIGENWSLTKLLSNYFPAGDPNDDFFSIYFYSDTAYARTGSKILKYDFLTDPSNPVLFDTFDWRTEYNNSGRNINNIMFNNEDIYFYGWNTVSLEYFMDVRRLNDFSLVKELDIPMKDQNSGLRVKNNKLLSAHADSVVLYEITDNYGLIRRSAIQYSLTLPWINNEFIDLRRSTFFLDENIMVIHGPSGIEVYDVSDLENPAFAGSSLDGGVFSRLRKSGDNFSIDWVLFSSGDYYSSGVELTTTGVDNQSYVSVPKEYKLEQNYPNPFNPRTIIKFSLPEKSSVTLQIYSILGELVESLINNKDYEIGNYEVEFDAGQLASGVYLYRLTSDFFIESKKMVLLR